MFSASLFSLRNETTVQHDSTSMVFTLQPDNSNMASSAVVMPLVLLWPETEQHDALSSSHSLQRRMLTLAALYRLDSTEDVFVTWRLRPANGSNVLTQLYCPAKVGQSTVT